MYSNRMFFQQMPRQSNSTPPPDLCERISRANVTANGSVVLFGEKVSVQVAGAVQNADNVNAIG